MAYSVNSINLLTPGYLQHSGNKQKFQTPLLAPSLHTSTNFVQFLTPQYLNTQQQYFVLNGAPFAHHAYTTGQQYLPHVIAAIPSATHTTPTSIEKEIETATKRPHIRDIEPTTRKPQGSFHRKPHKLQMKPEQLQREWADFKSDKALLKAVATINPQYVIEEIIPVPGKHLLSTKTTEGSKEPQTITKQSAQFAFKPKPEQIQLLRNSSKPSEPSNSAVKVEATSKTSTKGNIPFGSYFLPYFSQNRILQRGGAKKTAALVLEPHAKAVVGNGGTAISTPLSKAFLKRGVTTNVYFNPESVAIAGVGGKAHAQADLELDLIN